MNRQRSIVLALAAFALAGCDDTETHPSKPWALGESMPRFAVRNSDYTESSYGLLDVNGSPIAVGWITSGSEAPGLTALLSGDGDLPTELEAGVLTIIDRYQHDVITRVEYATGNVLGQVRTQGETTTAAYSSNPNDVVYLSPTSAWITRYEPNTDPSAAPDVKGNDLVELNPTTMALTGNRIDLGSLNTTVTVETMSGPVDVLTYARPVRVVQIGARLVVGLDRLSADLRNVTTGPGAFAVVDPATASVVGHDLPGLANCGQVQPVPGTSDTVLIRCLGGYGEVTPRAGLAVVKLAGDGTVVSTNRYVLAEHPSVKPFLDSVIALSDHEVLGAHVGGFDYPTPTLDYIYYVNVATDEQTLVLTSAKGADFFVSMAYDPSTGLVIVPDKTRGIHRFDFDTTTHTVKHRDVFAFGSPRVPVVSATLLP